MHHLRVSAALLAITLMAAAESAQAGSGVPVLGPSGIGSVRFGLSKPVAVRELSTLLHTQPTDRFINSGCGPRYTEVAWGHFYAEFRLGRFSGFRYIELGWPPKHLPRRIVTSDLPRLTTAEGVTLGNTPGELRTAYNRLKQVGTDRWEADGLIYYDSAQRDPPPLSSRIVEIKTGTCGDF